MIKKLRKQCYTLEGYLNRILSEEIRSDQDVQRLSGQWDNSMINELIVTILTNDYVPPVILGEERLNGAVQLWIIEGLQRSTSLSKFRYGNYKISSNVEEYMIEYQRSTAGENNVAKRDANGNIIWKTLQFDVRNKTYQDLPDELKNRFDEYQIEALIHEDCTMKDMSKLVRRYNNHRAMNTAQTAFTYIDNYARNIREITNSHRFFKDCGKYTQRERENGTLERIVIESVMAMFHRNHWQKQSKKAGIYLNENSCREEFDVLKRNLDRLEKIADRELSQLFNSKNSFLWFALFAQFSKWEEDDRKFGRFLHAFQDTLYKKPVNGISFEEMEKNRCTKDKRIVLEKLELLENLLIEYLKENGGNKTKEILCQKSGLLSFVRENVNMDAEWEDIEQYEEVLDGLILKVDDSSALLEAENRPSLVALVAYSFEKDIDLDEWIVDFFRKHTAYIKEQRENYISMKEELEQDCW